MTLFLTQFKTELVPIQILNRSNFLILSTAKFSCLLSLPILCCSNNYQKSEVSRDHKWVPHLECGNAPVWDVLTYAPRLQAQHLPVPQQGCQQISLPAPITTPTRSRPNETETWARMRKCIWIINFFRGWIWSQNFAPSDWAGIWNNGARKKISPPELSPCSVYFPTMEHRIQITLCSQSQHNNPRT